MELSRSGRLKAVTKRGALREFIPVTPRSDFWRANLGRGLASALDFSELPTSVNTLLTFVPTSWTATMMNTAIKLAINAYSIAVTPEFIAKKISNSKHGTLLHSMGPCVRKPLLLSKAFEALARARSRMQNRSCGFPAPRLNAKVLSIYCDIE